MEARRVKISAALTGVSLLFLDTAPVIYQVEKNLVYFDRVAPIFQAIDAGQLSAMTSPITLAECLVHPLRLGVAPVRQAFLDTIVRGANTTFVEIGQAIGELAAQLRADYNLRLPDALQLAAALTHSCDAFLTNDIQLKRVTGLRVLVLDELEPD